MSWQDVAIVRVTLFSVVVAVSWCVTVDSKDEYKLMPPLYDYENVTKCFEQYPTSVYCVVKTVLKPMEDSEVWQVIKKYSKIASYHEHSLLDRGMCVDACVNLVNSLNSSTIATFDTKRVTVEPYHLLSIPSERELPQHQARYGRILNICVNFYLQRDYNLSGYSELERCMTAESQRPVLDVYHVLFLLIVVLLCGAVGYATYTDFHYSTTSSIRNKETDSTTTQGHNSRGSLWMEFSLRRTWAQLVAAPKSNLQRDFAFVEIFRILLMVGIILAHVTLSFVAGPMTNMHLIGDLCNRKSISMLISLAPFPTHTFFTISGVMLAVHFLEYATSMANRIGWSFLWKGILMRYVRIFPVLFVIWLYHASWYDWFARGPADYRYFTLEKDNCRTNGWLNFLFLNSYFKYSNMCMQQTWHLAADFHFFLMGLPLLILINRHPRTLWPIVTLVTIFSFGAPIANLFYHKLPGVFLSNAKQLRFMIYADPVFGKDLLLSHSHTFSYFSGLFAGLAYHRYRTAAVSVLFSGKTAWLFKWVPLTIVLLQAMFAPLFYSLDYSKPMLWNAVYGAIHRCCWAAMSATGILYGATVWQGRNSRIHFNPILRTFSKLSFGVLMVQSHVIKSLAQNATGRGNDFSWQIFCASFVYGWFVCYAVALVVALMVELPTAAIFKRMLGITKTQQYGKETKQSSIKSE